MSSGPKAYTDPLVVHPGAAPDGAGRLTVGGTGAWKRWQCHLLQVPVLPTVSLPALLVAASRCNTSGSGQAFGPLLSAHE